MLTRLINDYTNILFKTVALVAICFISTTVLAQKYDQESIDKAKEQLLKAKENGVVIRFDTKEPILDSLKANGLTELLNKKLLEKKDFQEEVILAFRENYVFGKVYYSNSEAIVNAKGERTMNVFDLDGGVVRIDPTKVLFINPSQVFLEDLRSYYVGFAVQDFELNNLEKPFPYYVLKREGSLFGKLTYPDMVLKLQSNFSTLSSK